MTYFEKLISESIFKPDTSTKGRPRKMCYSFTKRFPVFLDDKILDVRLYETIGCSLRATNSLKNIGITTLRELIDKYRSSIDLMNVDGIGKDSAQDTMESIYKYMLGLLVPKEINDYMSLVDIDNDIIIKEKVA